MPQHLAAITLLVSDYDQAIAYYRDRLGFELVEDIKQPESKRWVIVAPPGAAETRLLLAKAATEVQARAIGNQTGGRVFLFLHTDDFDRDYTRYKRAGVDFIEEPRLEAYGKVVVFRDLFGNLWDLIEPNRREST